MQFNIPKTLDEMYATLNELFHYYRIEREPYEELQLESLTLARLTYVPKTDTQLATRAQQAVSAQYEKEKFKYNEDIQTKILALQEKITLTQTNAESEIDSVSKAFDASVKKIEAQAIKAGFANTNVVVQQTAKLESDKNVEIAKINAKTNALITEYTAQITALNERLENSNLHFYSTQSSATQTLLEELREKRQALEMEVFKYNNSLDEKEQRYENTLKQAKMRIKINYMEISNAEVSKDKLIDMGYYKDVIKCICGYFDTLAPLTAYDLFKSNSELAVYLDDFYPDILYLYRTNAGI